MHLPGGWRLSWRRVPIPPVPADEPACTVEARCRRHYLPADLRDDPAYTLNSPMWHQWRGVEFDKRHIHGYVGDRDYPFDQPPREGRVWAAARPTPPARRQYTPPCPAAEEDHEEEARDDGEDFFCVVFY